MMGRRRFMTAIKALFIFAAALSGISIAAPAREVRAANETLNVVATTSMIGDAVQAVGGDLVEVQVLMGPGVDPHAYRQTRSDIAAMSRADLVVWNGLFLEAQLEPFLLELGQRKTVKALAETVSEDRLLAHDDYEGRFDPHLWMDPDLWREVVTAARDVLSETAPEHAETFAANASVYIEEIEDLGAYANETLGSVPEDSRVLISAHDAFNYFGAAYGFEVLGIQGISSESEAGLQRIEELVDLIVERDVRAVFVETSVADRNIRALIEGAAARGREVTIGGELFSDAMGAPGTYEGTYIGMIDHNVTTITRALGGDAPTGGLNGRLSAGS